MVRRAGGCGTGSASSASLDRILPTDILGTTIAHAVLDGFADDLNRDSTRKKGKKIASHDLTLTMPVAKMLDWFIRHHPESAPHAISSILQEADRRWDLPAGIIGEALRASLSMDGELDRDTLTEYLGRVLPSQHAS